MIAIIVAYDYATKYKYLCLAKTMHWSDEISQKIKTLPRPNTALNRTQSSMPYSGGRQPAFAIAAVVKRESEKLYFSSRCDRTTDRSDVSYRRKKNRNRYEGLIEYLTAAQCSL